MVYRALNTKGKSFRRKICFLFICSFGISATERTHLHEIFRRQLFKGSHQCSSVHIAQVSYIRTDFHECILTTFMLAYILPDRNLHSPILALMKNLQHLQPTFLKILKCLIHLIGFNHLISLSVAVSPYYFEGIKY